LKKQNYKTILFPIYGIIIFGILYLIATFYYPGGSQIDKNAIGFSWANNYWCNLLNKIAINGKVNHAKPIAMVGMFILCLSLAFFWFQFPKYIKFNKLGRRTIQISGILAASIGFLLFTNIDHNLITNLASFFGIIAAIVTLLGLYKLKWRFLIYFALINLSLVLLNNILYYNKNLLVYLPIVQKISFVTFLFWICLISLNLYKLKSIKKI
jgi:hypothetical protein